MEEPGDKQLERRRLIQLQAWRLMAEKGYEGLTMRELSRRTGASTRTLYEMYGGKDAVLAEAFQERLRLVFEHFEAEISSTGLTHLIDLNEAIVRSIVTSDNFSRAYASVLASAKISIYDIKTPVAHFRQCLDEIREAGDMLDWVDLDLTALRIMIGQNGLMIQWGNGTISSERLAALYQMTACETLIPLTSGDSRDRMQTQLRTLHASLAGTTVF